MRGDQSKGEKKSNNKMEQKLFNLTKHSSKQKKLSQKPFQNKEGGKKECKRKNDKVQEKKSKRLILKTNISSFRNGKQEIGNEMIEIKKTL